MKKEIFESVLKYLMPYYKLAVSHAIKGKKPNVQEIIKSIDIKKLEKERSKEWIKTLKEQLKVMEKTIKKF